MANKERVNIIKKGADEWNNWRIQYEGEIIDLSGAGLQGANLSRANLKDALLKSTILSSRADLIFLRYKLTEKQLLEPKFLDEIKFKKEEAKKTAKPYMRLVL